MTYLSHNVRQRLLRYTGRLSLFIVSIVFIWLISAVVLYRVLQNDNIALIEGEVHFVMLELKLGHRESFESLCGNRIARLVDGTKLFVSAEDRKKLWAESPFDLNKQGYTVKASFEVRQLEFGGFGVAKLVKIERLNKAPVISKYIADSQLF